ncbi:hypothetical protein HYPSUDRAFT_203991 [Hypholoma sublateritium FD-334 SS-4]|uniref:Uncharacterized protein n=1 Tax=Hypholoma sublateritium (strain FD-334 SS-4) TaxID=945553 RepID=A0A0D2NUT1_HYPSF|nr:hypothetical protein HYPSUDRAFT_203991 [Hypholoma sublateritium FD-334 SS-4]
MALHHGATCNILGPTHMIPGPSKHRNAAATAHPKPRSAQFPSTTTRSALSTVAAHSQSPLIATTEGPRFRTSAHPRWEREPTKRGVIVAEGPTAETGPTVPQGDRRPLSRLSKVAMAIIVAYSSSGWHRHSITIIGFSGQLE